MLIHHREGSQVRAGSPSFLQMRLYVPSPYNRSIGGKLVGWFCAQRLFQTVFKSIFRHLPERARKQEMR